MVGFDHCGFTAKSTFHYVRIDGSLCKEINSPDFLCFFFEYTDKFLSDDLTFLLRLCNACKFAVVTLLGVDPDKIQVELAVRTEYLLNLIALVLTEKTVVNEYAGKLLSNGSG